jgi:putative membrane protein
MEDLGAADRPALPDATRLAIERTQLAHDRTLMAWIRTATSLISFGFTIFKFFEGMQEKGMSGRTAGFRGFSLMMIFIGLFCLIAATIQHRRDLRSLGAQYGVKQSSLALILAALISVLGVYGLLSVILGQ